MKGLLFAMGIFLLSMTDCLHQKERLTIYTIGDSTMSDKKPEVYPETGWCQVFPELLTGSVRLKNHAVNGRSTRSFIDEGKWSCVLDSLRKGDYVWIQFGHNDQKSEDEIRYAEPHGAYRENLERFIAETLSKGATPVLFTPIVRRKFDHNHRLLDTHGEYPGVVRAVARRSGIALIDLNQLTEKLVQETGEEESKKLYVWTDPDEKYPQGRQDNTHLSAEGAAKVAALAAEELKRQGHPLAVWLK